ncbi:10811_t:CDS:2, partial [Scutellospora calospora]
KRQKNVNMLNEADDIEHRPSTSTSPTYLALRLASPTYSTLAKLNSDENESEDRHFELGDVITQLQENLLKNEKTFSAFEYNERRAVYEYFVRLYDGHGKLKASEAAAHISFPLSHRSRHQKYKRLVDDKDVALKCRQWIREESGVNGVSPSQFKQYIDSAILPEYTGGTRKSISLRTAKRWLNVLGCQFKKYQKGMYFDGHERRDVVEYRREKMELVPPMLGVGEHELIFITHDECIFYSNDGKRGIWVHNGMMLLRKKGNRKSIIVSEFILEACGRLQLSEEEKQKNPNVPAEARCYLKPGKNEENYWTIEHLLNQIQKKAIPIFEAKFPDATAVFAFDNSTNHAAFADDALIAKKINKGPGGKQNQEMVFKEDYPDPNMRGKPKGIKKVLEKRRLWKKGLNLDCEKCKKKKDSGRIDCYLRKIMASQPDFVTQKSAIVELIEAKRYARDHCDYTWTGLQETVLQALDSVDVITIRKFAHKREDIWSYTVKG